MVIFFLFIFAIGILILPYGLINSHPFLQPSGQWQVGVSDFIWDEPERKGIIAKIWYPTNDKQGIQSPYIDRIDRTLSVITSGTSPLFKLIAKLYLSRVITPSFIDATLMPSQDGCPVVLFSPGFRSINFLNTFYALEFASYGIFIDLPNANYSNKELLLMSSNWEEYNPKDKVSRNRIDKIVAKDKIQREQLAVKANLHQRSFPSASHFNFMDLPLIIRPMIGKKIGLFGSVDGLESLLKTSTEMMRFFDE